MATKPKTKTAPATPAKQSYTVLADGRVAGQRVKKGDTIELTPAQAKYENVALAETRAASKEKGKS
ncbi:MAG: hypothetical protein JXR35_04020 [Rhodobacteraceae bacterium]|nr:hypothetical protein [Paracoccaceae bacterium]